MAITLYQCEKYNRDRSLLMIWCIYNGKGASKPFHSISSVVEVSEINLLSRIPNERTLTIKGKSGCWGVISLKDSVQFMYSDQENLKMFSTSIQSD